jgi:hypothetical protein
MDFKLEKVIVSLHSLKTRASAPLFLRNEELLGHSPILKELWLGGFKIVILEILLKVALNSINQTIFIIFILFCQCIKNLQHFCRKKYY